mgnify:CR=1 FL=1
MTVSEALTQYLELGSYFDPEYERENEVLNKFKKENPKLTASHVHELIAILKKQSRIHRSRTGHRIRHIRY